MATRELKVNITGDASSLNRAFRDVGSGSSRMGSALKKVGKVAAVGVGAAFAGMAATLKVGFDEMSEGQKVAAQTAAALKSTGGVANVTARDVDNLASSISRMTGIDDEAVAAGENMLLTFTNIRNEVGKGNDIFDQATVAIGDMATRMNNGAIPSAEQLSTTAIRVGKALNDPIKGMTALGRVGVQFTEAQKVQIKEMVKAGDTMGAQKLILAELNKEFGGSAKAAGETFPGQLAKLRNSFEEMAGAIVVTLLPYLERFTVWANEHMPQIQAVIQTALDAFIGAINAVIGPIQTLISIGQTLFETYQQHKTLFNDVAAVLAVVAGAVVAYIAVSQTIAAVTKTWAAAQVILNAVMAASPFVLIVAALAALAVALVLAYRRSETFREIVQRSMEIAQQVFERTKEIAVQVFNAIVAAFDKIRPAVNRAIDVLQQLFAAAKTYIQGVVQIVQGVIDIVVGLLTGDWQRAWDGAKEVVRGVINVIKGILAGLPAIVLGLAADVGRAIINGILSGLRGLADLVKDKIESGLRSALGSINPFSPVEEGGARYIGEPLAEGTIKGWITGSKELPEKMSESIRNAVETAAQAVAASRGALEAAFSELTSVATSAFDKITQAHETATEKRIRLEDEARAAAERRAALDEAQAQRAEAFASGDPAAIAAAEKAVEDAKFAIRRAADEKRAAQERKAYENRRDLQRQRFEEELEALQQRLLKGELTQQQAHERLIKLMKKYEIPFKNAAKLLGSALAEGLSEAAVLVGQRAQAIRNEILKHLSNIQVRINIDVVVPDKPDRDAPGRQHGGPVRGGRAYIVGEAGPELFVPRTSGQVLSNAHSGAAMAGGGVAINFYGPTVGTSREFEDTIRRALYDVQRRNPGLGFAVG